MLTYTNPILEEDNYIQTYVPHPEKLGNLLKLAKGPSRTMSEFAAECQTSASTFSRISNGKISKPLSFKTLLKIFECKDPDAKVVFLDLVKANGYEFKHGKLAVKDSTDEIIQGLMTACLSTGMQIQLIPAPTDVPSCISIPKRGSITINPGDEELRYWYFEILTQERLMPDYSILDEEHHCQLLSNIIFHHAAELLLEDAWDTEELNGVKISFVLDDKRVMDLFETRLLNIKVNGWISLILIDPYDNSVIWERYLTRKDGKVKESVFNIQKRIGQPIFYDNLFL